MATIRRLLAVTALLAALLIPAAATAPPASASTGWMEITSPQGIKIFGRVLGSGQWVSTLIFNTIYPEGAAPFNIYWAWTFSQYPDAPNCNRGPYYYPLPSSIGGFLSQTTVNNYCVIGAAYLDIEVSDPQGHVVFWSHTFKFDIKISGGPVYPGAAIP